MLETESPHFTEYRERIALKAVTCYIPPKFLVTQGNIEVGEVEALVNALARLSPQTWLIHSPAGSGKSSLAIQLMLSLLGQDVACVLVTAANLKHHSEIETPHALAEELQPPEVDETLWQSRAQRKRGKIVFIIDGLNEIQREFQDKPQWVLVRKLLEGNHTFPVLATSRYLPDDLDDTERTIFQLSLRPFNENQIQQYLQERGLNARQILDEAAAAGMQDATSNPFLLSLIAKHYTGIQRGFKEDWPKSRAELLRRTSRTHQRMSPAQRKLQNEQGVSQEAILCAASLSAEILSAEVVPLKELNALLRRVWNLPEQAEVLNAFIQDFIDLDLVENIQGEGWRFIHDSLLDFGIALACVRQNPDTPPVFAFISEQFDTLLGDWVGLHPDPDMAAQQVIEQARIHRTPEKLIDVALANRGLLNIDTQNTLWQVIGQGLLSSRQTKVRVADRLGDLPKAVLHEARRRGVLRPLQKDNAWMAEHAEKALERGSFTGNILVGIRRAYNRLPHDHKLPEAKKNTTAQPKSIEKLSAKDLDKKLVLLKDVSKPEKERRWAVMDLQQASSAEVSDLLIALLGDDPHESVRGAAANVLGQLNDRLAVEPLAKALLDTNARADIRGSAATALGQIGDRQAVEALAKALLEDADSKVRG
jgi:hypothetical protein